jgi:CheY-like chemotaxis protein
VDLASVEQSGRFIILVEDNAADAHLVREALESSAIVCELVVITNGERAIQFINEIESGSVSDPHLAIIDLNLPRKPGAEVIKRIRASAKFKDLPIVVLTSSNNPIDRANAESIGVSRYVLKPARFSEILKLGSLFREILGLTNDTLK